MTEPEIENPAGPDSSPAPAPAPPPAAQAVLSGQRTAREVELESQLNRERELRKEREVTISHLQDRLHGIADNRPKPALEKGHWLSGLTFFDQPADEEPDPEPSNE